MNAWVRGVGVCFCEYKQGQGGNERECGMVTYIVFLPVDNAGE